MSLSIFVSPNTKTGTSTIANYVALNIAAQTKELTLLIEFSRYTGRSIYMQRQVVEKRRSLKNVVLNPTDFTVLQENIMISKNNKNLYFLSMNLYEDFLEMKSYASTSLTRLINSAKGYFQHIVVDLPSDFEEPVVGAAFGKTFDHKIDNIFMVLDEDVLSFKKLYDFGAILRLGQADPIHVTYIVNKITKHYIDFIEGHLELPLIKPLNLIKLLYIDEMVDCCNKGTPFNIGNGREAKDFKQNIQTLTKIALSGQRGTEPIRGIGIKVNKKSLAGVDGDASELDTHNKKSGVKLRKGSTDDKSSGRSRKASKEKKEKKPKLTKQEKQSRQRADMQGKGNGSRRQRGKRNQPQEVQNMNYTPEQPVDLDLEFEEIPNANMQPQYQQPQNRQQYQQQSYQPPYGEQYHMHQPVQEIHEVQEVQEIQGVQELDFDEPMTRSNTGNAGQYNQFNQGFEEEDFTIESFEMGGN